MRKAAAAYGIISISSQVRCLDSASITKECVETHFHALALSAPPSNFNDLPNSLGLDLREQLIQRLRCLEVEHTLLEGAAECCEKGLERFLGEELICSNMARKLRNLP